MLKRILTYTFKYKRKVIMAISVLFLAIVLELVGPYLLKTIIDDHILGIEDKWYQVEDSIEGSVKYNGNYYIQNIEIEGKINRVVLIDNNYYFVNSDIIEGNKKIVDNKLLVEDGDYKEFYEISKLTKEEVFNFYTPSIKPVFIKVILFFVFSFSAVSLTYVYKYQFLSLGNKVTYDIRKDAFHHIQKIPISYYDKVPAGKVVARITNDTDTLRELFSKVLVVFIASLFYFVTIFTSLFILNYKLALVTMSLLPLMVVWGFVYRKLAKKYNRVIRYENSEINAFINESIKGMEIIQTFNHEEESLNQFQTHNNRYLKYKKKIISLHGLLSGNMVRTLHRFILLTILMYFGWTYLNISTTIEIGLIYVFVEYINRLINPVNQIFQNLETYEQSIVSAERLFHLLDIEGDNLTPEEIERFNGKIAIKNLSFAYESDNYVLKNINLKVNSSETVAIVGHTGSGKSSLMNLLLRFYDFNEGEILIDDKPINSYPKQAYRKHVGIVLQDPVLFTGTIADNIRMNDNDVTDIEIIEALNKIGSQRLMTQFKDGIYHKIDSFGTNLSVGEKQLIAFARALIYNPAILVLDEATANIDTETEILIQQALSVVKENRTTFIIAHRLSTIRDANKIVLLKGGEIIEEGNHEQLMHFKGSYYKMYQNQSMI